MNTEEDRPEPEVEEAFDRLVHEGTERLERPLSAMLATGLLGGVDIGFGVLAFLVVKHETGDHLLASIAFSMGFVALLLARSELFTENFLVPVVAAITGRCGKRLLLRLWVITLLTNLVGGALIMALVVGAYPDLRPTVIEMGLHYAELGVTTESFLLAVLAGATITLMTRMQHSTESLGVQIVPAVLFGFLLVGAELFHCILDALFMMGAMFSGADISIGTFVVQVSWAVLGNIIGGIGLVTALRVLRVQTRLEETRIHRRMVEDA